MSDRSTVGVVAFEGFEELDAVGPYDVFATAARYGAPVTVELASVAETDSVTASKGLQVSPDRALETAGATEYDYLIVPGGGWADRSETGAWAEAERGVLPEYVAAAREAGATVAAVCTGGMILERAGLLDGRPAVTHGSAVDEMGATNADVIDARVVDDGDVVTSGGVTAGIDMALWLVEREWGADVADEVAAELEHERSDDVYRDGPSGGPSE